MYLKLLLVISFYVLAKNIFTLNLVYHEKTAYFFRVKLMFLCYIDL